MSVPSQPGHRTESRPLTACFTNPRGLALSVGVKVRNNESIDRALKRFRRQVNRSRVLREFRQNMSYLKPSEEKRLQRKKAARRRARHRRNTRKRL